MTNVYLGIVMEIVWSSVRMEGFLVLSSFIASLHQTAQDCRSRHLAAFFLSWRCSRSDGSPRHPLRPRLSCFLFEEYVWQGQTVISRKTSWPDCSLCLLPRWWKFHLWWMMLHTVFKSFQTLGNFSPVYTCCCPLCFTLSHKALLCFDCHWHFEQFQWKRWGGGGRGGGKIS